MAECIICKRDLPNLRRKRCGSCNTKIRRVRIKLAAIKYLGGKCITCKWGDHPAALEFHHRNPEEKDFTISEKANQSWENVKKELNKCDLLCSRCHNIQHSSHVTNPIFMNEVLKYRGRLFT